MTALIKIGLTGGIATGKSTVLEHWSHRRGVGTIDTDALAHAALAPDTPSGQEVIRRFGTGVLRADGTVDRRRLGELVFADEAQRRVLEAVVHPAVRQMWTGAVARFEADAVTTAVVVCIPLLYEVGAETAFDQVVVVGCSDATQRARLAAKGWSAAHAEARLRAQWPLRQKLDRADYVIWNDGQRRILAEQADLIWATLKEIDHGASQN